MDYSELLKHPFWQRKRLEIFKRDDFTCQKCQDKFTQLQVHHKYYKKDCLPWEYPNDALITYCDLCHKKVEFHKWMFRHGLNLLVASGFGQVDVDEIRRVVFRRLDANNHRDTAIKYMDDIKHLIHG